MGNIMNELYNKSNKPMAEVNVDYIAHLKQVVADQAASNEQISEFLAARGVNHQAMMVQKHEELAKRVITNSKIDEWLPNL